MARELTSAEEIFETLGGIQSVAELTNSGYRAAFNWKATGAFPPKTFVAISEALRRQNCTAPSDLWGMVAAHQPEARAS